MKLADIVNDCGELEVVEGVAGQVQSAAQLKAEPGNAGTVATKAWNVVVQLSQEIVEVRTIRKGDQRKAPCGVQLRLVVSR